MASFDRYGEYIVTLAGAYGFALALLNPLFGGSTADFPARYPGLIRLSHLLQIQTPDFWLLSKQEDNPELLPSGL